jgi:N-acetylneuraminic acid mutarotase
MNEEFQTTNKTLVSIKIQTEGESPTVGLSCHTCCLIHDCLYIFGGSECYDSYSNLTYEYSIINKTWNQLEPIGENLPAGRKFHTAVVFNSKMYIWGGYRFPENFRELNQIYEFNPINYEYKRLETKYNPPVSFRHTAVIRKNKNKQSMVIFGGFSDSYLNEMFEYHFDTFEWEEIESKNEKPPPRYCHSAVMVNESMFIFGGMSVSNGVHDQLYEFNFSNKMWKIIENGNNAKKWNHTCLYNDQFNELWFFNVEVSVFNLNLSTWRNVSIINYTGVRNGTTTLYKGNLFVIGGFKHDSLNLIELNWDYSNNFVFQKENFTDVEIYFESLN